MIRRFSTTVLAVAILLGSSTLSLAAAGGGGERGGKIKAALAQLDLTTSQKEQIKQIVTDAKSSAKAGGKTQTHGAGKEILQKIMAVLTPQQKAKLKQILKSEKTSKA